MRALPAGLLLLFLGGLILRPAAAEAQTDTDLDQQCIRFADTVIPAVLTPSPWDFETLASYGVPDLRQLVTGDAVGVRVIHAIGEAFGPLISSRSPLVEVTIRSDGERQSVACAYRASGTFANGPGQILFRARLLNGRWEALSLNVNATPEEPNERVSRRPAPATAP